MNALLEYLRPHNSDDTSQPSWILTYGFAILSTLFFFLLKRQLDFATGQDTPLFLIFTGTLLSAWFGGLGPGLLSTLLALLLSDYYFIHQQAFLPLSIPPLIRLAIFVVEGSLISILSRYNQQAHHRLRHNTQMQHTLLQSQSDLGEGVVLLENNKVIHVNAAAERISGYAAADFINLESLINLVIPEERPLLIDRLQKRTAGFPVEDFYETTILNHQGQRRNLEMAVKMLHLEKNTHLIVMVRDITEKKINEEAQRKSAEHYRLLIENVRDYAIFTLKKNGEIASWNEGAERILGYEETEIIGSSFACTFAPEERACGVPEEQLHKAQLEGRAEEESWHIRKDGSRFFASGIITPLFNDKGILRGYIKIIRDITEHKLNENKIQHQALHDSLTQLPNRALFGDRVRQAILNASVDQSQLAILFLDLDQFKNINDTLGHAFGDTILTQVAKRIVHCVGKEDTVARLGGDEFTILLPNLHSPRGPIKIAERVFGALKDPFVVDGHEIHINTSIGITRYPQDGKDADTLLRNADIALYQAKAQGRNSWQQYSDSLNQQATRRVRLENDLRQALLHNALDVHYQPIVDLASGTISRVEALVRWQHSQFGLLPPGDFIPIAEESGLVIQLNEWVLHKVCQQIKEWQKKKWPAFRVSVNVSARQFTHKNFLDSIRSALKESGLSAKDLELEITESFAMQNIVLTGRRLAELKKEHIHISIDDFGTGHSSLNYLKQLPADTLKIDKSFIKDCTRDPQDAAIVRAIIAMAHSLDLQVIAEGVETADQLQYLQSLECDAVQGFLLSKPVPGSDFSYTLAPVGDFPSLSSSQALVRPLLLAKG